MFNTDTVIVTWDTLHMMLTLAIYITLIILIWATKMDPCKDNVLHEGKCGRESPDRDIPKCLSGQAIMNV